MTTTTMAVVIIPAYKPDETLVRIADELWTYGCRIIVVDDGSGKEYQRIFEQVKDVSEVLVHEKNRGKGAAVKTALSYIKNEMWESGPVGIMDADGQHLPKDMARLLEAAKMNKRALVIGIRNVGKAMPLKSRLGNQITRMVFKAVTGVYVSDTQTGLRAFDSELITSLLAVEGERYEYEMNVLMDFARAGVPIHEVSIQTIYRDKENSSSHFRVVKDSVRVYRGILKFTLSSFSSFILDYFLFLLCMLFLPHTAPYILLANIAARMVSAFYNYSMNCRFVFHTNRKIKTAIHYFALAGFVLVMNNLLLETFVQIFHISVYPAKLLTECLLFVLSWLVQRYVIFQKDNRAGNCSRGRQ